MPFSLSDPSRDYIVDDHFLLVGGEIHWGTSTSGTGASVSAAGVTANADHPGQASITPGTTSTGIAALRSLTNSILFGSGSYEVCGCLKVGTLSTAGDEYILTFGFGDSTTNADHTDGVYFEYDRLNSVNWRCVTNSNKSRTTTDSGVAVSTDWINLIVTVNADATAAEFLINGNLVARHTANIPTEAGRGTGFSFHMRKSAGTTALYSFIDHVLIHFKLKQGVF